LEAIFTNEKRMFLKKIRTQLERLTL